MYAATETAASAPAAGQICGIPVHPGVDASAKAEDDWWRIFNGILSTHDAVHYTAGSMPPRLTHLVDADMADFSEVTLPDASEPSYLKVIDHNRRVRAAVAENKRRAAMRTDYRWQSATALATALDTALRPKAASLLFRLQKAHRNASRSTLLGTDIYDGHEFVKTMRAEYAAGENNAAKIRSYEFHEGRYLQMRGSKLPDGCASQDFADKCNELETQHLPYFRTIRLENETLSECYLDFMPAALAGDARRIADELRASGKFDNPAEVKRRATQVVAQGADAAAEHSRLAMSLGYGGTMPGANALPASPPSMQYGAPPGGYPGLHSATPANPAVAPPATAGGGGMSEADVRRIVAAAVQSNRPPAGGAAEAEAKRKLKAEERKKRGRLPEGKRCKAGTCDLNHDEKYPGRPCYSDPRVAISVPHEYANSRPGALDRLKERRATEGKRLGVTPKPVTVLPAGAPPACALGTGGKGFDGLDDWGAARPATLGSAAGMHPLLGAPPIVTGTVRVHLAGVACA